MQYYKQQNRQFEADILTVGCIAGVMRMVVAIYRDLPLTVVNLDFVVDCSLCLIFLIPLFLLRFKILFEYIAVPFSALMIFFLCANWMVLNGLNGQGEYYFIGGMILIALINNGNWLKFFVTTCIILEMGLLYTSIYRMELMTYANPEDINIYHYLWVTIVVTIALLYHKSQFDLKRNDLKENKKSLEYKVEVLERQNNQLEEQKKMLQESNNWLEKSIEERSEKLMDQRQSIEKYLSVTLFEIEPYLKSTVQSISNLDENAKKSAMGTLLVQSSEHLQSAIQIVNSKLKKGFYYNPKN
ncbi:MAG: hypothetical protein ABJH98_07050 [Reichenbachiella sp.]|uniref:hypothetical protein n=1 Tax=Reichenbachiella sp. TaxID=2184521 RepID=UPI003296DDAE